jgi:hypothetical protein
VAQAEVTEITLKKLVAESDLIVLARVSKIDEGPADIKPVEDGFPAVKVATAQVIETWKGDTVREIRYVASPTRFCDIASAEKGERVVLFLTGRKGSDMMIAHVGRGRMPLRDLEEEVYASIDGKVMLPEGTPTISESKTARLTIPWKELGLPDRGPLTISYHVSAIEVKLLRQLVKSAAAPKAPMPTEDQKSRKG